MNIEILLFDGFDEFDAMAPWEVFAGLAQVTDRVRASFVTLDGAGPVRGDHGAVVMAQGALSERPDLLWVPGGGWLDPVSYTHLDVYKRQVIESVDPVWDEGRVDRAR